MERETTLPRLLEDGRVIGEGAWKVDGNTTIEVAGIITMTGWTGCLDAARSSQRCFGHPGGDRSLAERGDLDPGP